MNQIGASAAPNLYKKKRGYCRSNNLWHVNALLQRKAAYVVLTWVDSSAQLVDKLDITVWATIVAAKQFDFLTPSREKSTIEGQPTDNSSSWDEPVGHWDWVVWPRRLIRPLLPYVVSQLKFAQSSPLNLRPHLFHYFHKSVVVVAERSSNARSPIFFPAFCFYHFSPLFTIRLREFRVHAICALLGYAVSLCALCYFAWIWIPFSYIP